MKSIRRPMIFTCLKCEKKYENFRSRAKTTRYCSKACFDEARRHYRRCFYCDRIFRVKLTKVDAGKAKFCSRSCYSRYLNHHQIYTCICGQKVSRKPSQAKGRVFCSRTCFITFKRSKGTQTHTGGSGVTSFWTHGGFPAATPL